MKNVSVEKNPKATKMTGEARKKWNEMFHNLAEAWHKGLWVMNPNEKAANRHLNRAENIAKKRNFELLVTSEDNEMFVFAIDDNDVYYDVEISQIWGTI